jgi:Baseplate J-like protein
MPVAPSFNDTLAQFEAEALTVEPTLAFRDGDMMTAQEHGAGAMADAAIRYSAQAFKATFIDGAEGDELTQLVDDHLNLQRNPATAASVDLTFTRTGTAAGTMLSGFAIATVVDSSGNTVQFTTDTAITWGTGDLGPHIITATASVVGSAGDVAAGTVTRLVDAPFDTTIAVTNADDAAGGNDAESDTELRLRARNFWVTLRRGTLAALEFGALEVASVRTAKASEDNVTGNVTLVVGDSNGASSAQMLSDVEVEIEDWRSAGVNVTIIGGTQLAINVTGTMVFRADSGADPLVYGPLVEAAITARMLKYVQGEVVYLDALKAAAIAVDPDVIEAFVMTAPTGDTTPMTSQTPRAGTVTAS